MPGGRGFDVNTVIAVLLAVFFILMVLVLTQLVMSFIVRQWGASLGHSGPSWGTLRCPQCESSRLALLPTDRVSPLARYLCRSCSLEMRPRGSRVFYSSVLILSIGLIVLFSMGLWAGGDGPIAVYPFMFVVAISSIRQLLRPTPRLTSTRACTGFVRVPERQR